MAIAYLFHLTDVPAARRFVEDDSAVAVHWVMAKAESERARTLCDHASNDRGMTAVDVAIGEGPIRQLLGTKEELTCGHTTGITLDRATALLESAGFEVRRFRGGPPEIWLEDITATPVPLLATPRGKKEGRARFEAEVLSPGALAALLAAEIITPDEAAAACKARFESPPSPDGAAPLAQRLRALRGGGGGGGGTSAQRAISYFQRVFDEKSRSKQLTDLRWSPDGTELAIVAESVSTLRRVDAGDIKAESVGGRIELAPRGLGDVHAPGAKPEEDVALTMDWTTGGRQVTGWRHGAVKIAGTEAHRYDAPVTRVRAFGDAILVVAGGRVRLGDHVVHAPIDREGLEARIDVAWALDGKTFAVSTGGNVTIYDVAGTKIDEHFIADVTGRLAACAKGYLVPTPDALAIVGDGSVRFLPRASHVHAVPGDVTAHGTTAVVRWVLDLPEPVSEISVFDLATNESGVFLYSELAHVDRPIALTSDLLAIGCNPFVILHGWTLAQAHDDVGECYALAQRLFERGAYRGVVTVLELLTERVGARSYLRGEAEGLREHAKIQLEARDPAF